MKPPLDERLPHIVVVGAGFGGLTFAQKFPGPLARITVVDRQNHHLFQPLLYQVATAGLSAVDIAQPIRAILRKKPNLEVLMADVTGFDLAAKKVLLDHGVTTFAGGETKFAPARGELAYDYLVLAAGGLTSYYGHDDWEKAAPGLKTLDDALAIRRKVLLAFERAESEPDEQRRKDLMTIIVVGGGPTGVELAGTFAELARTVLVRDFDRIDPSKARVLLIEGGDRVLAHYPPDLSTSAQRQLEQLGVEVWLGKHVKDLRDGEVEMPDGEIIRGSVIWGAGVVASPLTKQLGAKLDRAGRVEVLPDLSVPGHPEAFAIGDLVTLTDPKGKVVPGVAPAAMQMGEHVAKTIARELREGIRPGSVERAPFVYWDKGSLATIGRSAAVAQLGRLHFGGWLAWLAWLFVHLVFLVGLRNRIAVFFTWVYSYLTYKRGARIITGLRGGGPAGSA